MIDEIPEAIRDNIEVKDSARPPASLFLVGGFLGLGIIGLLSMFLLSFVPNSLDKTVVESTPQISKKTATPETKVEIKPQSQPAPIQSSKPTVNKRENLLGHLPYNEAPEAELAAITLDGSIQMRQAAATKFQQMQAAAKAEGVILTAISGFRTTEAQDRLFFGVKEQRVQNAAKRAEVSAPPGYSEHHTGYAVDIGDGKAPSTNVNPEFENTEAFAWLEKNAARYSFELSFPRNNSQGISYEPWHWRFVGDRDSLETFYKVRNN